VTIQQPQSGGRKNRRNGGEGNSEQTLDEGRPFAEIRRNLHSVLGVLTLHRWAFLVPFCLVTSAAFIVSLDYPRSYSASTSFERRNDPVLFDLPLSAGAHASFDYFRSTMHADLTSVNTMNEVVDNLGLTRNFSRDVAGAFTPDSLRQRTALSRSLGGSISVIRTSPSNQIDILHIAYKGPDPLIGKRLVEEVKKVYIRRTMAWMQQFLERQKDYFVRESAGAMEELQLAQRELSRYLLEHPYANLTDPALIATRLTQLESEKREMLLRKREYDAERESERQQLAALGPQPVALRRDSTEPSAPALSPAAVRLRTQYDELQKEIHLLRTTRGMTDQHPRIRELLTRSEQLQADFDHRQDSVEPAPMSLADSSLEGPYSAWHSERARVQARLDAQEAKIAEIDISLATVENGLSEVLRAKEGVFDNQDEFTELNSRVSKAKLRHGNLENVLLAVEPAINALSHDRLMQFIEGQPARGSSIPVSPKANTVVLLALLAGVAAGAIVVILAEVLDHVYRSSGQVVRHLGLPILEAIDEIVTAQDRRRLLVRRVVIVPMVVLVLVGTVGVSGLLAYVSIERPWTYQRLTQYPRAAARILDVEIKPPPPPDAVLP